MIKTNKTRIYYTILGGLLVLLSLPLSNPFIGIGVSLLLALTVFIDKTIPILYLLIFIPIRPFLIVCNTGYKWLGILLIGLLLLYTLIQYKQNLKALFSFHYFEKAYFVFCLFGAVVAYFNNVAFSAIVMQLYAFLLFYLMYYIVSRMNFTKEDILIFITTTFTVSTLMSVQGIIEKLSLRMWLLPGEWVHMRLAPTNWIRVYGLIGGPNELALYLIIAFILSLYLLHFTKGKSRILLISGLILIGTTFWLTYSRGAILTLLVFIPAYLIINKRLPFWKQIIFIALISFCLSFAIGKATNYLAGTDIGSKRFTEAFSKETLLLSNKDGRIFYVKKALEIFHDKPLTGYGFATFGSAATQTYSSPIYKRYGVSWNFYSDNQYIQILAETGIVGVILITISIFGIYSIFWKYRKGHLTSPLLLYLFIAAISGSLVYNMLENDVFLLFFFSTLGLINQKSST